MKEELGENGFLFPLSAGDGAYNPIHVVESGTPDHIGTRCLAEALDEGYGGSPIEQNAVAAAWDVAESLAGGAKLTLQVQWGAADELPGFDRNNCGLAQYDPTNGWVLDAWNLAPAGGDDPFTRNHGPLTPACIRLPMKALHRFHVPIAIVMRHSNSDTYPTRFLLYPNPSSEALFFEIGQLPATTETITVQVFDSKGVQVLKQQLEPAPQCVPARLGHIGFAAGFYDSRWKAHKGCNSETVLFDYNFSGFLAMAERQTPAPRQECPHKALWGFLFEDDCFGKASVFTGVTSTCRPVRSGSGPEIFDK
ncbi:MAG: T9SS type A sorting domain-containing protein [Lewinellaceae bacterium]|nr:T9SS type A sorting domain-containing protein [Lewinellaceae bacterium]